MPNMELLSMRKKPIVGRRGLRISVMSTIKSAPTVAGHE
jgi:hypothetical protein